MENSKTAIIKSICSISNTKIYFGNNNELICLKVYTGDWGDWDDKPDRDLEKNQHTDNEYHSFDSKA